MNVINEKNHVSIGLSCHSNFLDLSSCNKYKNSSELKLNINYLSSFKFIRNFMKLMKLFRSVARIRINRKGLKQIMVQQIKSSTIKIQCCFRRFRAILESKKLQFLNYIRLKIIDKIKFIQVKYRYFNKIKSGKKKNYNNYILIWDLGYDKIKKLQLVVYENESRTNIKAFINFYYLKSQSKSISFLPKSFFRSNNTIYVSFLINGAIVYNENYKSIFRGKKRYNIINKDELEYKEEMNRMISTSLNNKNQKSKRGTTLALNYVHAKSSKKKQNKENDSETIRRIKSDRVLIDLKMDYLAYF